MNNSLEMMNNNELMEIDGGSIGVAILAGCGILLVIGAGVSFFNGYSDAAGK